MFIRDFIVAGFVVATPFTAASAQAPSPVGKWIGAIDVPGQAIGIQVNIEKPDSLRATIDIESQGVAGFPLKIQRVGDDSVAFTMPDVAGDPAFRARFQGDSLWGSFVQGGQPFTFKLHRKKEDKPSPLTQTLQADSRKV